MTFLAPQLLWLLPLAAVPVIIHLLNRLRYRVVRWAAIDFLLANEQRAVRRAKLQQILLMILRTALIVAAVLVLARPVFRGSLAGVLGGSSQVAVALDASASMAAQDARGQSFERARQLAARTLREMGGRSQAVGGAYAAAWQSPFREPLSNRDAVAGMLEETTRTAGAGNVPAAILAAAGQLRRNGGGGTLWLLSDLQAGDWRAGESGAWKKVRDALDASGRPRLLISDVGSAAETNVAVESVRLDPPVVTPGRPVRLLATLAAHGPPPGPVAVTLHFGGERRDRRTAHFDGAERVEMAFDLPPVHERSRTGRLELTADAMPADDVFHFLVRPSERIDVLVVAGWDSPEDWAGPADFLELAIEPPGSDAMGRSPLKQKTIPAERLAEQDLSQFAAVFLADVPRLDEAAGERLHRYARDGGLVMIFPGARTDAAAWNERNWLPATLGGVAAAGRDDPWRVDWIRPNLPLTRDWPAEGLGRLAVKQAYELKPAPAGDVIASLTGERPLLVGAPAGRGSVFLWSVSARPEFSNLPFTSILLMAVHRAVLNHYVERARPPAVYAFEELRFPLPPGRHRIRLPDGEEVPVERGEDPSRASFSRTARSGVYELVIAGEPSRPIAAVNVPPAESALERIAPSQVRDLLAGIEVSFVDAGEGARVDAEQARRASLAFPLALLAMGLLVGEVLLGWSISRESSRAAGRDAMRTEMSDGVRREEAT